MGFVGEHLGFGAAASLAFLPADFFDAGLLRDHFPGLQLFDFIEQQTPGDGSIESLLPRGLALDLEAGGPVQQHDTCGRFINILTSVPARSHKSFFDVRFAHAQGSHALGKLPGLFWIHGRRRHGRSLVERVNNRKKRVVDQFEILFLSAAVCTIVGNVE